MFYGEWSRRGGSVRPYGGSQLPTEKHRLCQRGQRWICRYITCLCITCIVCKNVLVKKKKYECILSVSLG